jgi:23S rRNA (uracil1939-C5)-methyltransferase
VKRHPAETSGPADPPPALATLAITRMGAQGDGVAETPDGPVFIAGALPGETVTAARRGERAELVSVDAPSPDRVEPICRHFGACGGCATQHWAPQPAAAWKRGLVVEALARAGVDAPVAPIRDGHGAGRRRVTLHGRSAGGGVAGFMQARSHDLIAIDACPILEPGLATAPTIARAMARALASSDKPLTMLITATLGGLDVDIRGHGPLGERLRRTLTALADDIDLARLSAHGEIIVERRQPLQPMGEALVLPPPGSFLQPTRAGEELLTALAIAAVAGAKRVADLFAGCGPFALRLARSAEAHAVESEAKALIAQDRAARAAPALRRITTEARDLFRRPMLRSELARFDAVVLDPPRAGAEAQVRELAASPVPSVAYVSCDPASFARDAAILTAGGLTLEGVTPVDQFRYSHHVEVVGVFRRGGPKRRAGLAKAGRNP